MNISKLIGGILLIVGTAIGAGMLALPVTTAPGGFLGASILLLSCWVVMTLAALLILEVNLWLPAGSNIVSMAKSTLGRPGEIVAWITYLLLLYSLLAAYISGGGDVLHGLINSYFHLNLHPYASAILFLVILGGIVYHGITPIDYVNRILMSIKLIAFLFLILLIAPHVSFDRLNTLHTKAMIPAITVVITSFGFANIIPSLRGYFKDDVKNLRLAIIIGSLIPLSCYFLWIGVIFAEVPVSGVNGLFAMLTASEPTSLLLSSLNYYLNNNWINSTAHLFTSICVATSFMGVALSLTDFLADGFKIEKSGKGKILINLATFMPPLIVILFYPAAFIMALNYAGIFCVILLVLLPALMAWTGRYKQKIHSTYQVMGGKTALILLVLVSLYVIVQDGIAIWAH